MKKTILLLFIAIQIACLGAQSEKWNGRWAGILKTEEVQLPMAFKIDVKYAGWYTRLSIPLQNLRDYVISGTVIDKRNIIFKMESFDAEFEGRRIDSNTIRGTFKQHGKTYPLTLERVWGPWPKSKPQTPRPPYRFISEKVKIPVANGRVMIAGTLSRPDSVNTFPAIILISGSGPQDRNGTIGEHEPFLILADFFSQLGFAVFRYDDRGIGETKGRPETLKSTTTKDIAQDVSLFVDYLKSRKDIDTNFIGLLGHSEGGMVAPMVAANRKDIAFIISLAGAAAGGMDANLFQSDYVLKQANLNKKNTNSFLDIHKQILNIIVKNSDTAIAHRVMDSAVRIWAKKAPIKAKYALFRSKNMSMQNVYDTYDAFYIPWWRFFLDYQPSEDIKKLKCPVLALNGTQDIQVNYKSNLEAFEKNISDTSLLTIKAIPGLNHMFQHCKTCTVSEYYELDETLSPEVMKIMKDWLVGLKKSRN